MPIRMIFLVSCCFNSYEQKKMRISLRLCICLVLVSVPHRGCGTETIVQIVFCLHYVAQLKLSSCIVIF